MTEPIPRPEATGRERLVSLPRTAESRRARESSYHKLIRCVERRGFGGWDFHGVLLRSSVPEGALHPGPDFPALPIVLEFAGPCDNGKPATKDDNREFLWLVWRLDGREWKELGRTRAHHDEWQLSLGPVADLAIRAQCPAAREVKDLGPAINRLVGLVRGELDQVAGNDRGRLAAAVHDALATEIVRWLERS